MSATTFKQDMPPKGGYGPIDYKRALPKRGPSGYLLLSGVAGMMAVGLGLISKANRNRTRYHHEEIEAKFSIRPLLEAEKDRDYLKVLKYNREQEAIIMKDVPGWVVDERQYHNTRWTRPTIEELYYLDDDERWAKNFEFNHYV